ncbi:MAG TPA: cytochrome C [Casimicrobiaceae bacterium]|jgi:mono/diheme cytochrome c family protein|nr:cytochrome C [Casimicrobiaceae bacterium]
MHQRIGVAVAMAMLATCALAAERKADAKKSADPLRDRGRYVVSIAGCNDCHTPGYAMSGGQTPEKDWLVGDTLGWRGPWGTTYPVNLRLYMQKVSEREWVEQAKSLETRPPMPWFSLHRMTDTDLRAVYRFIRALGPAGNPAPAFVPPNQEPRPPFVTFPAPPK